MNVFFTQTKQNKTRQKIQKKEPDIHITIQQY